MRLHIERGGAAGAPVRVRTTSGLLAPRILRVTPTSARVALIATGALLLAGDHVELDIAVDDGLSLDLVEVAATVAYAGRGDTCSWSANLTVAQGASLRWMGEPFVVATDARATRATRADVAEGGSLVLRDTLVLGRHGEAGGDLAARTDIAHGGRPALVEELHLSAADDRPGIRGGARVIDQVTTIGQVATMGHGATVGVPPAPASAARDADREVSVMSRPVAPGVTRLDLLAPGHVDRWLGHDTHLSPLAQ